MRCLQGRHCHCHLEISVVERVLLEVPLGATNGCLRVSRSALTPSLILCGCCSDRCQLSATGCLGIPSSSSSVELALFTSPFLVKPPPEPKRRPRARKKAENIPREGACCLRENLVRLATSSKTSHIPFRMVFCGRLRSSSYASTTLVPRRCRRDIVVVIVVVLLVLLCGGGGGGGGCGGDGDGGGRSLKSRGPTIARAQRRNTMRHNKKTKPTKYHAAASLKPSYCVACFSPAAVSKKAQEKTPRYPTQRPRSKKVSPPAGEAEEGVAHSPSSCFLKLSLRSSGIRRRSVAVGSTSIRGRLCGFVNEVDRALSGRYFALWGCFFKIATPSMLSIPEMIG